jgi:hypothetical protein
MQRTVNARTKTFFAGSVRAGLFAALAAPTLAGAADGGPAEVVVGVGLLAAKPQSGSLSNRTGPGPGASLSFEWAFSRKHAIRAGFEYVRFGDGTYYERGGSYPGVTGEYEGRASVASLALDYVYSFASRGGGLYIAIGTGYGGASVEPDKLVYGEAMSGSGFRYSAGIGFGFAKNFGVEASLAAVSTYDSSRQRTLEIFGWQQIALRYRFSTPSGAN